MNETNSNLIHKKVNERVGQDEKVKNHNTTGQSTNHTEGTQSNEKRPGDKSKYKRSKNKWKRHLKANKIKHHVEKSNQSNQGKHDTNHKQKKYHNDEQKESNVHGEKHNEHNKKHGKNHNKIRPKRNGEYYKNKYGRRGRNKNKKEAEKVEEKSIELTENDYKDINNQIESLKKNMQANTQDEQERKMKENEEQRNKKEEIRRKNYEDLKAKKKEQRRKNKVTVPQAMRQKQYKKAVANLSELSFEGLDKGIMEDLVKEILMPPYGEIVESQEKPLKTLRKMMKLTMHFSKRFRSDLMLKVIEHFAKYYQTRNKKIIDMLISKIAKQYKFWTEYYEILYRQDNSDAMILKILTCQSMIIGGNHKHSGANVKSVMPYLEKMRERREKAMERTQKNSIIDVPFGTAHVSIEDTEEDQKRETSSFLLKAATDENIALIKKKLNEIEVDDSMTNKFAIAKLDMDKLVESLYEKEEGISVVSYGSSYSGLSLKGSDIDMLLLFENEIDGDLEKKSLQIKRLKKIENAVKKESCKFEHISTIRGRVVVIKLKHKATNVEVDLTGGLPYGMINSGLLRNYVQISPFLKPLVLLIKHWAKQRNIADPPNGTLSSYSYVILTIAFLQEVNLLPSLQNYTLSDEEIKRGCTEYSQSVSGIVCRYVNLDRWEPSIKIDPSIHNLCSLLHGFFSYYFKTFNPLNDAVSMKNGGLIVKPQSFRSSFPIQDPFESRDLGVVISEENIALIFNELKRGYFKTKEIMENTGDLSLWDESITVPESNRTFTGYEDYEEELDENEVYVVGLLRVNSKNRQEAYVTNPEVNASDILIYGDEDRNRAIHGDKVRVKLYPLKDFEKAKKLEGKKFTQTGKVVNIIRAANRKHIVCSIKESNASNSRYCFFQPLKIILPSFFVKQQLLNTLMKCPINLGVELIVCADMKLWKASQKSPRPENITAFGLKEDYHTIRRSLYASNFPTEYFGHLTNHTIPLPYRKQPDHVEIRDERQRFVFTIDPKGSRDLDDAMCIEMIGKDKFRVYVYIADVVSQIPEKEYYQAGYRTTSVYMPGVVEHMLSSNFSAGQCSILGEKETKVMAVAYDIDMDGNTSNIEAYRAVIYNYHRLTYEEAQDILDENLEIQQFDAADHSMDRLKNDITLFHLIAHSLRSTRMKQGSFNLKSEEIYFDFNENEVPTRLYFPDNMASHHLIEEFMLLTNRVVATHLHLHYGNNALFRCHDRPEPDLAIGALCTIVSGLTQNHVLKRDKALVDVVKDLPSIDSMKEKLNHFLADTISKEELHAYVGDCIHRVFSITYKCGDVIDRCARHAILTSMRRAEYHPFGEVPNAGHYGLQFDHYTHFTSPIRRFADILVHLQLEHLMDVDGSNNQKEFNPNILGDPKSVNELCTHINEQGKKESEMGVELTNIQIMKYIQWEVQTKGKSRHLGLVLNFGQKSFTVFFPGLSIEQKFRIFTNPLPTHPDIMELIHDADGKPSCLQLIWRENLQKTILIQHFTPLWFDLFIEYEKFQKPEIIMVNLHPASSEVVFEKVPHCYDEYKKKLSSPTGFEPASKGDQKARNQDTSHMKASTTTSKSVPSTTNGVSSNGIASNGISSNGNPSNGNPSTTNGASSRTIGTPSTRHRPSASSRFKSHSQKNNHKFENKKKKAYKNKKKNSDQMKTSN